MPLVEIWNSPQAIAKRSEMIAGRHVFSGYLSLWCSWREGKPCATPDTETWSKLLAMFKDTLRRIRARPEQPGPPQAAGRIDAIRRLLKAKDDRIRELEAGIADPWEKNAYLHDAGQAHIDRLESIRN